VESAFGQANLEMMPGRPPQPRLPDADERIRAAVVEHYDFLWRSVRRLGVDAPHVEDAVQQVLVVFSRRIDEVREGAERAFLFGTATRVASDYRKKRKRGREHLDSDAVDNHESPLPSVEQLIDQGRAREIVDLILAEMPMDMRTVFVLFEFEEMTMATIARMLDVPSGTVASRLRRARAMFEAEAGRLRGGRGS
jgi:RNA polymerase sigma-70 factor (ECF subfamily)